MISDAMLRGMVAMRPCVPSRDHAQSLAFYERIGFSAWPLGELMAHMQLGDGHGTFCFLLQGGGYVKEWAENSTMHFLVDRLDPWWEHLAGLKLDEAFGVEAPVAPKVEPWGLRVAYFRDPAGVLWHVAEDRAVAQDRDR